MREIRDHRLCQHRETIETSVGYGSGLALLCMDCGDLNTFVPWGPATITPAVEIEIRAAELASDWGQWFEVEQSVHRIPASTEEHAIYLAHCIRTHSEEAMTDEDLRAAKALCEAATRGPWQWREEYGSVALHSLTVGPFQSVAMAESCGTQNSSIMVDDPDAAFIADARTLVPQLIAEVERLREALDARERTIRQLWESTNA